MANLKNVMEDEQALTLLNNGLVKVDKYKKVINKILQGSSEASACKKYGVDVARFRRFLRTEYIAELKRVEEELNNLFLAVANTVVEDLDIHLKTYNCLKRTNLNTIGDIVAYVRDGNKLKDIRNFGAVSLGELNEALSKVVERKVTLR